MADAKDEKVDPKVEDPKDETERESDEVREENAEAVERAKCPLPHLEVRPDLKAGTQLHQKLSVEEQARLRNLR